MIKPLKKYFIPHQENDYRPHFLRRQTLSVLGLVALLIFLLTLVQGIVVGRTGLLADVISSVLVDLANHDRLTNQVGVLKINPLLVEAAQEKANDMAKYGYFAHQSPTGLTPWYWFVKVNYPFVYAGENLAINFSDSVDVEEAWMNSRDHKANILNDHFTEIGIATARGLYQGQETTFVVQMFGLPALARITPPATPPVLSPVPTLPEAPVAVNVPAKSVKGKTTDDLFIAVKNEGATPAPSAPAPPVLNASPAELVITSPGRTLSYAYFVIGALVVLALLLAVFVEIKRQYPPLIIGSFLILFLIGFLFYAQHNLLASQLLIK